jgi:signal transduction histidine kinase
MNPIDLLGRIIAISHSNVEIPSRLKAILNVVAQEMGFEDAIVYTLDSDKRLTCRFMSDESSLFQVLSKYRCFVGEGIVGSVAQKRMPQYFTIKDIPPRFGCLFYRDLDDLVGKYKGFAFLPLSDDSYLYGTLFLGSTAKERLQNMEKMALSMVAREIGGILRTNGLIVSTKRRISELATLSELGRTLTSNAEPQNLLGSIALIIAKALNATFVAITLEHSFLKLESQRFTYGQIEPSVEQHAHDLEKEAAKSQQTVVSSEQKPGPGDESVQFSLYVAPMLSQNRFLGTLTICGSKSVPDFALDEDGRYLINTIANYVSSGLENALLNKKLRSVVEELNTAQKRLVEQETFKSLGEMTASIAHEIKNPLVIIGGFTKRLAKKVRLEYEENKYVDIILSEVSRLETILDEILNYVKDTPVPFKSVNVNDFIDDLTLLFSSDGTWERIRIVKDYGKDLPSIVCDNQQMKQVLINILINAFDAMEGSGKIVIKTEQAVASSTQFIAVSITDTGGGVDPGIIDDIFNPFFTTKDRGTGLGLAISNKIVMNHQGHIEVRNFVGKGATFTVYLPTKNNLTKEELS